MLLFSVCNHSYSELLNYYSICFTMLLPLLIILLLFSWMGYVGVVRAEFLRARNFDYIRAAKALGVSTTKIIFRHMIPNATVEQYLLQRSGGGGTESTSPAKFFMMVSWDLF